MDTMTEIRQLETLKRLTVAFATRILSLVDETPAVPIGRPKREKKRGRPPGVKVSKKKGTRAPSRPPTAVDYGEESTGGRFDTEDDIT